MSERENLGVVQAYLKIAGTRLDMAAREGEIERGQASVVRERLRGTQMIVDALILRAKVADGVPAEALPERAERYLTASKARADAFPTDRIDISVGADGLSIRAVSAGSMTISGINVGKR